MILTGKTILEKLENRQLNIEPIAKSQVQPASVDLRLGTHFLMVNEHITPLILLDKPTEYREVNQDVIIIPPHSFILGTTLEYINLPNNITAFVEGRSSIGRLGLFIQNAGWVDPGFQGHITLELYNANSVPIQLKAGRRICQLVLASLDKEATPYLGKYCGQHKTTESRIYLDEEASSLKAGIKQKFKQFD